MERQQRPHYRKRRTDENSASVTASRAGDRQRRRCRRRHERTEADREEVDLGREVNLGLAEQPLGEARQSGDRRCQDKRRRHPLSWRKPHHAVFGTSPRRLECST